VTAPRSTKYKPYGVRDVIAIAAKLDVHPDTVYRVLAGGEIKSRARQRVWHELESTNRLHWIFKETDHG
jgi:hypothetical protein